MTFLVSGRFGRVLDLAHVPNTIADRCCCIPTVAPPIAKAARLRVGRSGEAVSGMLRRLRRSAEQRVNTSVDALEAVEKFYEALAPMFDEDHPDREAWREVIDRMNADPALRDDFEKLRSEWCSGHRQRTRELLERGRELQERLRGRQ